MAHMIPAEPKEFDARSHEGIVFKKIKKGRIKAEKIGRNYIIKREDVNDIIGNVLTEKLTDNTKKEIGRGVAKIIKEYGEVLKKLGKE